MLTTNRNLYRALGELGERHSGDARSLELYLLALLGLAREHHRQNPGQDHLMISDFYRLLAEAFEAEPVPFEAAWRDGYDSLNSDPPDFHGWEARLLRQIVDLREMEEAGTLADEQRYFGINAPRGARWYNFAPTTYLECAMAGALGGWEPDDPTGRQFVPGMVAVLDENGDLQSVDARDIERVVVETPEVSWEQFTDFIECGQM